MDSSESRGNSPRGEIAEGIPLPDFDEWLKSYLAEFNKDFNGELSPRSIPQESKLILFAIRNIVLSDSDDDSIDR